MGVYIGEGDMGSGVEYTYFFAYFHPLTGIIVADLTLLTYIVGQMPFLSSLRLLSEG